ncbi:MAG: flagellar protein FliL [Gaiellales bacterium]|jgi:flagellar FliL protein|nr:flagellar protein FliL [Gaiellales bacterium]
MSAQLKTAEEAAPPKKSKKMLFMIIGAVLMLGGGAGGGYFIFAPKGPPPPPVAGKVIPLDSITVNLANGHFLKIGLALQATADAAEAPDGSKAKDLMIAQFSNKPVAELSSEKARDHQKEQLKDKIVKAYTDEAGGTKMVMDIYFTEFVMQ